VRDTIGDAEGTATLKRIREDVAKTTENIERISSEARAFMNGEIYPEAKTIHSILTNVDVTTARLRGASDTAARQLDGILDNAETLTADLKRFIGDQTAKPGEAKDGTVAKTLSRLDKNMALLEGSLESIKSVTAKIDQGEGTVGRLINDDKLVRNFEKIVSDIGDFTGRFNAIQVDVEFRSEYNFGAAAMKHYVSLKLRPKPDKYYFFQVIDDPRGGVDRVKRVTTSNDPDKPPTLTETIVTTESKLKFTAQFAKRWHFLTFRYGLMESTGGWGVDAELLEDALRFKLDVFDFDFQALPRVRILAAWNFIEHIYVAAGMDDILNSPGRDYFIGLGVTFTDGDLKSVLPLAPSF
jgi:phospholipid/cholesterol/gamma-HCH transport system substrate-binding protein